MEITYALEPEDLWRYNKFVINRVPAFRAKFGFRLVIVPLGLLLLFAVERFPLWLACLVGFGFSVLWVPFCLWSARRHHYRMVRDQPDLLGKHILRIGPDGVRQITDHVDTLMQWNSFSEIIESREQIYFFMTKRLAIVIPKHAFVGPEAAQAFLTASKHYQAGLAVKTTVSGDTWPPPPRIGN